MSRTDKDMPMRAQVTWFEAVHAGCENDIVSWHRKDRECDLPAEPDRNRYAYPRRERHCDWSPLPDRVYRSWYRGLRTSPPAWFVDHIGHNAERRRARDECIEARKQYRATGDIDIIPTTLQHRHQAQWLYW